MTRALLQYTVHPFGDEWLWDRDDTEPLVVESRAEAVGVCREHVRSNRERNRGEPVLLQLLDQMWFELRDRATGFAVGYIDTAGEFHRGRPQLTADGALR